MEKVSGKMNLDKRKMKAKQSPKKKKKKKRNKLKDERICSLENLCVT